MQVKDKVALVTGAADERSIGWGIAQTLGREGARLILNDLPSREADLSARVKTLQGRSVDAVIAPADLTQADQVTKMMTKGVEVMGRLDILCSNAGIIRWENFLDITPKTLRNLVDINVKGTMYTCKEAAKQMIKQGDGGRIVITSSVQSNYHFPISPVYGATKHSMNIFVGALALELASHKITVNHIGPGWVKTAINDQAPELQSEEAVQKQAEAIPLRRAGTAEEMAQGILYFASDAAAYTTGAYLPIDGGLSIGKYSY